MEQFEAFFRKADLDGDGRISGAEAVAFFEASGLPKAVLAQIWMHADESKSGFLGRPEFYNALRLVTVAQSKRELTPEIVKAALYGPAASKIPPPQINVPQPMPNNPVNPSSTLPWPEMKPSHVQKYTKVFMEVDTDRDGLITGEEARNLFLSWRLPREILKQVWDLSDQDNDSMLSLREFCFALYLMERFREGRSLPTSQPKVNSGFGSAPNSRQRQQPPVTTQKVEHAKSLIMDSKEKLELYRTKMQELILYKSRCDNKLNEITERALADKREAESLGKKYEERYKQVAEIASKLTIEEATFHDIQERKTELNQAIVRMEQGGSVDGVLQVRADRIQYDLEELVKALNERCKKHGLGVKSSAVIELPNGWEPGIEEGAAVWDEEWDNFEDKGFLNDLTVDVKNVSQKNTDSVFAPTEDDAFSDAQHRKHSDADAEIHRSFDDSTWSAFDNNDFVWGSGDQKTNGVEPRDMFGSDSFSGSPNGRKGAFDFDESVPSTPMSRYSDAGDHYFDNFSRFEEGVFSAAQPETLTRFDSMNSTTTGPFSRFEEGGFSAAQPETLTRFDSMNSTTFSRFDSISSSTDFGTRFDSSSRDLGRFDSINSSKDFGFGDSDPFKVSSPKKGSDNWNAF